MHFFLYFITEILFLCWYNDTSHFVLQNLCHFIEKIGSLLFLVFWRNYVLMWYNDASYSVLLEVGHILE